MVVRKQHAYAAVREGIGVGVVVDVGASATPPVNNLNL